MSVLYETEEALHQYKSNLDSSYGSHLVDDVSFANGRVIGEKEFDIAEDDPMDINRMATLGLITHRPYVDVVKPMVPLNLQIVTYHRQDESDPAIVNKKLLVARRLAEEIADSMPSHHDNVFYYEVGHVTAEDGEYFGGEVIEAEDDQTAAEEIANICIGGMLTVVLSDFEGLPLGGNDRQFSNAVGVKINHPIEKAVEIPKSVVQSRARFEVRTGKKSALGSKDEVELFNVKMLREHHQRLESQMRLAGFAVASALFSANDSYPFNVTDVDLSIAKAIQELSET